MHDVIIIGTGCSGFGAAIYSARFNLKTLVIGETPGGTIILTDTVENYPGFIKLTGMELAQKLEEHAKSYGIEIEESKVTKIEKQKNHFSVFAKEKKFDSKTIIFATGTKHRKLEAKGEKEFLNKGVHYCALCDAPMYKNKTVAIVGGSDSAAKEALVLAQHSEKVFIIYRGEKIRPEPINLKRIESNKKIEVITKTSILEILGNKIVEKVKLDKAYKGSNELKLDAVFVSIGLIPLSELAKQIRVKTNEKEEIIIDREAKTNIAGFFAAGDVVDTKFKQAITGVAEGVTAAYSAYKYINENSEILATSDENNKK